MRGDGNSGNRWLSVCLFLGGLLAGTVGAGGVGAVQYAQLERKMEDRYLTDHERLIRIEQDVKWIKEAMRRMLAEHDRIW